MFKSSLLHVLKPMFWDVSGHDAELCGIADKKIVNHLKNIDFENFYVIR